MYVSACTCMCVCMWVQYMYIFHNRLEAFLSRNWVLCARSPAHSRSIIAVKRGEKESEVRLKMPSEVASTVFRVLLYPLRMKNSKEVLKMKLFNFFQVRKTFFFLSTLTIGI